MLNSNPFHYIWKHSVRCIVLMPGPNRHRALHHKSAAATSSHMWAGVLACCMLHATVTSSFFVCWTAHGEWGHWLNESLGEWGHWWMSHWVNGSLDEWGHWWMSNWMNEGIGNETIGWMGHWMNEGIGEWVIGWMGHWMNESIGEWVHWLNGSLNEWGH